MNEPRTHSKEGEVGGQPAAAESRSPADSREESELGSLSPRERAILVMRDRGRSVDEIAGAFLVHRSVVVRWLKKALMKSIAEKVATRDVLLNTAEREEMHPTHNRRHGLPRSVTRHLLALQEEVHEDTPDEFLLWGHVADSFASNARVFDRATSEAEGLLAALEGRR